jgi:hypothetical protein
VRQRKARGPATDRAARRPSAGFSSLRDRDATADLQVYSGQRRLGSLRHRGDDGVEAFDLAGRSIGTFLTMQAAAAAIPEQGGAS